ncbi:MAG TPA: hypothetical protein VJL37_06310 [Flavobacterium sp.]|nr:hypothetical protein [Flavobacterium sp.]
MLQIGGYINIVIALGHLIGLFWAEKMFEVTGIGKEMIELAQTHASLPYLLTVFVAVFFFIFGLYGLSADGKLKELPYLKPIIFVIAAIYLFRGIGELIADMQIQQANASLETLYSIIAIAIGLLFLIGGVKKWNAKANT